FFSSRRRHTRLSRDWSSDVCSSDLLDHTTEWTKKICQDIKHFYVENIRTARRVLKKYDASIVIDDIQFEEINHRSTVDTSAFIRSEERRVGKEWRSGGSTHAAE